MKYNILQETNDLKKKNNGAFKMFPLSQKNNVQDSTGVAIPDDRNVEQARNFIIENKK